MYIDRVSDVRQMAIHTAEPLVLDPSPFEVENAILRGFSPQANYTDRATAAYRRS
jgi:hypothetical protein